MAFFLGQLIVLLAVLAVSTTAFGPKSSVRSVKGQNVLPYNGRFSLQMGSHGIYDIKSNNGVHSISFEVRSLEFRPYSIEACHIHIASYAISSSSCAENVVIGNIVCFHFLSTSTRNKNSV